MLTLKITIAIDYKSCGKIEDKIISSNVAMCRYFRVYTVYPFTGLDYWTEIFSFFGQVSV